MNKIVYKNAKAHQMHILCEPEDAKVIREWLHPKIYVSRTGLTEVGYVVKFLNTPDREHFFILSSIVEAIILGIKPGSLVSKDWQDKWLVVYGNEAFINEVLTAADVMKADYIGNAIGTCRFYLVELDFGNPDTKHKRAARVDAMINKGNEVPWSVERFDVDEHLVVTCKEEAMKELFPIAVANGTLTLITKTKSRLDYRPSRNDEMIIGQRDHPLRTYSFSSFCENVCAIVRESYEVITEPVKKCEELFIKEGKGIGDGDELVFIATKESIEKIKRYGTVRNYGGEKSYLEVSLIYHTCDVKAYILALFAENKKAAEAKKAHTDQLSSLMDKYLTPKPDLMSMYMGTVITDKTVTFIVKNADITKAVDGLKKYGYVRDHCKDRHGFYVTAITMTAPHGAILGQNILNAIEGREPWKAS